MPLTLEINDELLRKIDNELAQISILHRNQVMMSGMRAALNHVRKRTRSKWSVVRDKKRKRNTPTIEKTLNTKVYEKEGTTQIVGRVRYKARHGHLVELGHEIVRVGKKNKGGTAKGRVEGRFDLANAAEETKVSQVQEIDNGVRKAMKKITGQ